MTFEQVIKAALPDADPATIEHVLWGRTSFPMGEVTAQSLYRSAASYGRACRNGISLCELCDRIAVKGQWTCEACNAVLKS